ncbi:MAG: endolytic transglycosylase MltG, partial [Gammaproteobacteria bacterium]|nr:endolytic transglycosylase MltG [Gammaproteobacteria bacterium]
ETGQASEREVISGVFVRRLKKGMRLQTDPTVIYGIGAEFDGNLTREHLRRKTAYNTYTNYGLPPTPIALPGRDAILAALHPAPGDALYFVARGDGSHAFAATLSQHQANVRKYQLKK